MPDQPTVGLFHALETIDDFLDPLSRSFDDWCDELTGGWLFGYVDALSTAGVRTVVFCVRRDALEPTRHQHRPTGATIWSVPAPAAYRALRAGHEHLSGGPEAGGPWGPRRALRAALSHGAHLLSTPVVALVPLLRAEGCQALLCQEYEYPRFEACLLMGRRLGIPVFASFQGGDRPISFLERPIRRFTVPAAAGLIIAPRAEVDGVQARYGVPERRIWRIFNPLDAARWEPAPQEEARRRLGLPVEAEVVCWHGRVEMDKKGLDVLVEAWERVTAERPGRPLRLLMVGTGRDAPALAERLAGRADVRWRDEYVLDKDELRLHLSAADLYAFPSRHEGMPVAVVEAMACGLPVVAAAAYSVKDIVEEGEPSGGIIVPPGDATAFAAAMGALLDDPARRQELGRRARERALAAFSLEAVGRQLREAMFPAHGAAPPGGHLAPAPLRALWRLGHPVLWRLADLGDRHHIGWLTYNPALMLYYHRQAEDDAPAVMTGLQTLFPECHRYLDIGAGSGAFAAEAMRRGKAVQACEHSRIGRLLARRQGVDCRPFDLRRRPAATVDGPFDLAYCLEVAEHVDEELGRELVDFAASQARIVVFTAAQPGQGGHGHVNEQPRSYWIDRFGEHGMKPRDDLTARLAAEFRRNGVTGDWLAANLIVFERG